jgi:hypothetical protein
MGFVSKPVRTVEVPEPASVPLPDPVPVRERRPAPPRRERRDQPVPA